MKPGRSTPGLWSDVMGDTWRPGGLELTDRAIRYCDFPAQARIVDVGCGRGATVDHLRGRHGFQAWGVDIRMEALARTPPGFQIQAKADALPLVAGSLDGLFCECVVSLLASPSQLYGNLTGCCIRKATWLSPTFTSADRSAIWNLTFPWEFLPGRGYRPPEGDGSNRKVRV